MSGPKVIDYRAVERQRMEAARRRWLALCGRAESLRIQCVRSGHPDCAVTPRSLSSENSADLERRCDELSSALAAATEQLRRLQFADRTREVASSLSGVLNDLKKREQQAAENTQKRGARQTARLPELRRDLVERVARQLASLPDPSPELKQAAAAVLAEADEARARLLYDDFSRRTAGAMRRAALLAEQSVEIAELRAQLDAAPDPAPIRALLDNAAGAVEQGQTVDVAIRQAREAITRQLDTAAAAADREFVRSAVMDSLQELGYRVTDVDVATPETLVVRQDSTHGVRADLHDGRIDIRSVRLGSDAVAAGTSTDRDAEEEFCARLPGLLSALGKRGVVAGVISRTLPGLVTPETVALRAHPPTPADDQQATSAHTRRRTAQ